MGPLLKNTHSRMIYRALKKLQSKKYLAIKSQQYG